MTAYYNENNREAAAWLRELVKAKVIADGHVDERDVRDVRPNDLDGFVQCHFFAGIGVWSYALRLAGWRDEEPVWTGSCPCQPFSASGKGNGFADERHLWPSWFHLIEERRPGVVLGEQVASPDGLVWVELVQADMEGADFAFWSPDLCAAGVGAPHIRQRLWFVAESGDERRERQRLHLRTGESRSSQFEVGRRSEACELAYADGGLSIERELQRSRQQRLHAENGGAVRSADQRSQPESAGALERPGPLHGFWRAADWIFCRDNKWRPVEPGSFPLAHGTPARLGRLRGYGNAIVAEAAATFVETYMSSRT